MSKNDVIRKLVDALIETKRALNYAQMYAHLEAAQEAISDAIQRAEEDREKAIAAGEAELAKPEPEILGWTLKWEDVNHLQRDTVELLVQRCKHAHTTDVKLRIKGKDEWYEADWLKHLHLSLSPQPEPVIPEGWKIVPVEPTEKMLDALYAVEIADDTLSYKAMLSSAPDYKG